MTRIRSSFCALLVILALTLAGETHAAWPRYPDVNVPVSTAANHQIYPAIVEDGAGGAFIAWHDNRGANYDIYVQRVSAAGAPLWTANGVLVCGAAADQANAQMVSDGAGGVIVTWHDYRLGSWDIYAQRFNPNGVAQWTANGVAVCQWPFDQPDPHLVPDGQGGAIIAWEDQRSIASSRFDVYAQRVNAAGVLQWPNSGGIPVCSGASGLRGTVRLVSDGAGGAIISWRDARGASNDIYAQRLNSAGTALWIGNGVQVAAAVTSETNPTIASDGQGGAFITWQDDGVQDIMIQRVNPSGSQLLGASVPVCNATGAQSLPQIVPDGVGGAIVVWQDPRAGFNNVFAQRVNSSGTALWTPNGVQATTSTVGANDPQLTSDGADGAILVWTSGASSTDIRAQRVSASGTALWGATGIPIVNALQNQAWARIVPDAADGAIISWHDTRGGGGFYDVYAQRVDHYGNLGNPEPALTSVRDTPNDQGGKVKVSWTSSYLDADPTFGIVDYRLWRSAPQALVSELVAGSGDRRFTRDADEAAATGALLIQSLAGVDYAWELVASQAAAGIGAYSLVTATTSDSVPESNPLTVFAVEARAGTGVSANHWWSAPDSGYSVDNLPPAAPAPFTGVYSAGSTALHWAPNGETDFAHYRLYRGATAGFIPAPANLVGAPPDTGYVDPAGTPFFYKLSAVDDHGNESAFALLAPSGTVDAPAQALPSELRLGMPQPNPASVSSRIAFNLPRASQTSLVVYDASGRAVRELFRGVHAAGGFDRGWDLRDDAGRRVANGVYFVRLESGGRAITRRMITMR